MATYHNGSQPPFLKRTLKVGDSEWFYTSWQERLLNPSEVVTSVSLDMPNDFSLDGTIIDHNDVRDEYGQYAKCNGFKLSTTSLDGTYAIYETVTTNLGNVITNGFNVKVKNP